MTERSCCFVVQLAKKFSAVVRHEEQGLHLVEEQHELLRKVFVDKSSDVRHRLRELRSSASFMQPFDPRRKDVLGFVQTGVNRLRDASERLVTEGADTTYKLSTNTARSLDEILDGFTETLKHNEIHMRNCADKHPSCYATFNRLFNEIITRAKWLKHGTVVLRQLAGYQKGIVLYDMYKEHIDNFEVDFSKHPTPRHVIAKRTTPRPVDEASSPLSSFYHVVDLLNGDLLAKPTGESLCWKYTFDVPPDSYEARPSVNEGREQKVYMQLGQIDHVCQKPQQISQGYQKSGQTSQELQQSGYIGQNYQQQIKNIGQTFLQPRKQGQAQSEQPSQRNGQPVSMGHGSQQPRHIHQAYYQPGQMVKPFQQKEQFGQVCQQGGQVGQTFQQQGQTGKFYVQTGQIDQLYQQKNHAAQSVQQTRQSGPVIPQTGQKRGQVFQQIVQIGQQRSDIGQVYQQSTLVGKQVPDRHPTRRLLTYAEPSAESLTKLVQKPRAVQSLAQGGVVALLPKRGNPPYSMERVPDGCAPAHQTRRSGAGATLASGIRPFTQGAKKVLPAILRKGSEKTFEIFSVMSPPDMKSPTELKPIKVPTLRSSNMKPLN